MSTFLILSLICRILFIVVISAALSYPAVYVVSVAVLDRNLSLFSY